jgi:hypothetical protein
MFRRRAMKIGIIIPVKHYSVKDPMGGMDPREADISKNAQFAEEKGAVYWDINILEGLCNEEARKRMGITFPTCCYFYNAENKMFPVGERITHKAELLTAYSHEELENRKEEHKFIPEWRMQCFEGRWSEKNSWVKTTRPDLLGKSHKKSTVWIKLRNFIELIPPKKVGEFHKLDGSFLIGLRGAYIQCLMQ